MTIVTKEMLKDMRDAERMVIWRDHNGQGALKLTFEDEVRNQKVETEKWYLVHAVLSDYAGDSDYQFSSRDTKKYCVFCDTSAGSSFSEFNTAARCLKEGDEITFKFMSQQNGNIKNLDVFLESIHLEVRRQKTKSSERMTFTLDSNTYANNSAKMVGGNDLSSLGTSDFDPTDYKFVNRLDKVESNV